MNNDTFSWPRLRAYLRKTFMENRGTYGIMALIAVLGSLLFTLWIPQLSNLYVTPSLSYDPMVEYENYFFTFMFHVWLIATGCMFYSAVSTKGERIAQFTLPVSNFEKFTAYFLIYTVAMSALFLVAVFFADIVRTLAYSGSGCKIEHLGIRDVICIYGHNPNYAYIYLLLGVFSLVFNHSIFVLGSILWSKNTFLKTTGAYIVIFVVFWFAMLGGMLTTRIFNIGIVHRDSEYLGEVLLIYFPILAAIFCFAVSYLRFREQETINRW